MRHLLLAALLLNASLLGVRCLQERHVAEAARPRAPVFTQAQADVLAHFRLVEKPWTRCQEDDGVFCMTQLLRIEGCSVQVVDGVDEPGSLFVGSDVLLNPFDEWPFRGVRVEGTVEAVAYYPPQ